MLFIQSQRFINLKNPQSEIVSLFAAFNSSALIALRDFNIYMILHISKDGQQLFRLSINQGKRQSQIIMIDSSTVAVTNSESNIIKIIDLKTYTVRDIKHNFGPSRKVSLFYFQETKLLCVAQQSELQITYYSFQGEKIHKSNDLRSTFQNKVDYIGNNYIYWKANRKSMIVCQQKFSFNVDLKAKRLFCVGLNGFQKSYEYSQRHYDRSLSINNIWSSKANQIYCVGNSFDGVNLYCIDDGQIMQKTKYCFRKYNNNDKSFGLDLGLHSAFSKEPEQSVNQYQCIIVENQIIFGKQHQLNQKHIVFQSKNIFRSVKYAYPSQQPETVIIPECYYSNNENIIKFTEIRWSNMKEIRLHFMLHINEDFDKGLLFDASQLLEEER